MATTSAEAQDRLKLYKFTKILTLKVAQIVVQSRHGKKITQECNNTKAIEHNLSSSPSNLQWFNLSIPDEPEVTYDTKKVLNGEVVNALAKVLCIEISLRTNDGDRMVLEIWTVRIVPGGDPNMNSISTIYYRMSIMLKSTLSISRITPAYKMSRSQHKETYTISHKIYGGDPNFDLLGEKHKTIKVSDLRTSIGTILIEVAYRTKMTILPEDKIKPLDGVSSSTVSDIMVKSDHFYESPKKTYDKKEIDLSKPLTAGAFVDTIKIKELHDALSQKIPPEPPMSWLLAEKDKLDKKLKGLLEKTEEPVKSVPSNEGAGTSSHALSKAIEVPKANGDKYTSLMEFPFADGSPLTELATFYQECLQAKSTSDEWTELIGESVSTDSESLSQQLKMFEEAVPEFDNMVASMFSNSDCSDHS
ncbi:unnamed protein product [Chilo suppressalis]|uniref:Autophagy-related protein 13 n=1 Tax=Chilo suppressalis TaxID=168631 RepID=A0ABN8B6U1_CHISP|nr:hypothetical protein evm_002202 [Chilo suppressalis]CAH0402095.1 unnamed protein product [Chilo suppressalis]